MHTPSTVNITRPFARLCGLLAFFAPILVTFGAEINTNEPPEDSMVLKVYCKSAEHETDFAFRDDTITIVVTNLSAFLASPKVREGLPKDIKDKSADDLRKNLVPFMDLVPMAGSRLVSSDEDTNDITRLTFKLARDQTDETSRVRWAEFITSVPTKKRFAKYPVEVTVGFAGGWRMATEVRSEENTEKFYIVLINQNWAIAGLVLIGIALGVFVRLAATTAIIRDPNAPLRPDGTPSFSLARTQMAFWFFLIIASFFWFWLMTDDTDTIPNSVLVLMGISAGTVLGSALLDSGRTDAQGQTQYFRRPAKVKDKDGNERIQSKAEFDAALVAEKADAEARLTKVRMGLDDLSATATVERDNLQKEQALIGQQMRRLDVQLDYYRASPLRRFMVDVLADDGAISFHRFQIAAWTVVLGLVFVQSAIMQLKMPVFNETLLGLMGISSGTYLGFKIPGAKQ